VSILFFLFFSSIKNKKTKQTKMSGVPEAPNNSNNNNGNMTVNLTDKEVEDLRAKGRVIGDYALLETIGKGSFGKVRRGVHIPTKVRVAVKILNRQALASGNMDKKIKREIKILKLFNHAHICRLYDVLYTPGDIFVVMEYCGKELYDHIVRCGRLDEAQARHIFQQIVCALEYCHHFRVVHRDLKPENILYSAETKTAKLIDFGLANIMQDGEFLRTSCGSPNYAAPEVISGRLYAGPEVDVWSCGVVLYALLCGCLPFDEDNIPALFSKIKRGKFSIPSHVSPEACDLINQILVVDPVLRITISQLRDHPWFCTRLPKHLYYRPSLFFSVAHIDEVIMEETATLTGASNREIKEAVANWGQPSPSGIVYPSRLAVVYNILLDAQRQREILSAANLPDDAVSTSSGGGVSAAHAELNHGLVLTVSPAIALLLDTNDATTNKRSYNSTHFLPRSAHEITKQPPPSSGLGNSFSSGPAAFGINAFGANNQNNNNANNVGQSPGFAFSSKALGSGPSSFSERVGSFQQARSLGGSTGTSNSLPGAPPTSLSRTPGLQLHQSPSLGANALAGGNSLTNRGNLVGVVAKTNAAYSADEELFHVQNNTGWRVGLMTDRRSNDCIAEVCNILRNKNMEWKVVAPYMLAIRRKVDPHYQQQQIRNQQQQQQNPGSASRGGALQIHRDPQTVIQIHLLRIQEKHEKGFVVDFFFARGCPMAALEMTIEIWRELLRRVG
jgi:5'-AMP-activated protein kinase, catalytic alpha subunit